MFETESEKTFSFARFPINGFVKHEFTIGHNGQLSTSDTYGRFPAFGSIAHRGENIEVIVVDSFIEALRDELDRQPDIGLLSPLIYEDKNKIQYAGYMVRSRWLFIRRMQQTQTGCFSVFTAFYLSFHSL